jgi:hypothetical protein
MSPHGNPGAEAAAAHDAELFGGGEVWAGELTNYGVDAHEGEHVGEGDQPEVEADPNPTMTDAEVQDMGLVRDPETDEWYRPRSNGEPPGDDEATLDESWRRVDLGPALRGEITKPAPTVLRRDDGAALFTAGCVNWLHGDSGDGKSMAATLAAAQELRSGEHVVWVDFEEPDPTSLVAERLRDTVGVDPEVITAQLHYYGPLEEFSDAAVTAVVRCATEHGATLIVIDSLGEAFGLEGIDENKDVEVAPWVRRVARALADSGPAVLILDHSTKAGDNPLYPSGSKRKRAAVTGQGYLLEAPRPLTREHGGRLTLKCAKDRHGHYQRGAVAAAIEFSAYPDGGMTVHVWPPAEREADAPSARLYYLARAAVRALKNAEEPLSQKRLLELMDVKASDRSKKAGIEEAEARHCIRIDGGGSRGALLHHYVRDLDPAERRP